MTILSRPYFETDMGEFRGMTDNGRVGRGKTLRHYFDGVEKDPEGQAVLHWIIPSQTKKDVNYDCYIDIVPKGASLFSLAGGASKMRQKADILKNADVKCFCTCPDFNWSGAIYNMKHGKDSLSTGHIHSNGVPEGGEDIPPDIRDPERKHFLCKHLVSAFNGTMLNAAYIMKQVRDTKFAPGGKNESGTESHPEIVEAVSSSAAVPESTDITGALDALSEAISGESADTVSRETSEKEGIQNAVPAEPETGEGTARDDINGKTTAADLITENLPSEEGPDIPESSAVPNKFADLAEESELPMFDVPLGDDDDEKI